MKAQAATGPGRMLLRALSPAGRRARLQILTYHRVLPTPDPLLPDEPDAAAFTTQMAAIARYCEVLALPEAARRLAAGTLPACAACITFDDGYGNNHEIARPILERLGFPATIFIAGDAVDRGVMWNDLVIEAIRRAQDSLDLEPAGLGTKPLAEAGPRAGIVTRVLNAVKYRPLGERWALAVELYERNAGGPLPRLMMTRAQVQDLASRGFDVGSHTVTHPILATLAADQARAEIAGSWRWVLEVAGVAPRSFAYPNGRPGRDFNDAHATMVHEAGFEVAVTTVWGSAKGGDDPLQLPRYTPWETSAGGVLRRLAKTTLRSYLA